MDLKRLIRDQWDRALAIVLAGVGLVSIYLGFLGVADALVPAQQIPYVASGGLVGLFLLGAGATLWLSSDLRDEWRLLDDVLQALEELKEDEAANPDPTRVNGARAGRPARRAPLQAAAPGDTDG